jgi:ribosome-associated protein
MTKTKISTDQLITQIIAIIEKNKGLDIKLLDLREIENAICDYFIICSGTSNTHVEAMAGHIEKEISKTYKKPWHIEGTTRAEWVLLDYIDIVVHIFQKPIREHYDLEGLWGDAKITDFSVE